MHLCSPDKLVGLVPRGAGDFTDANIGGSLNYDNMLKSIELYINNIFVNPEVHNIFIKRIGFTLIRVHRQQTLNADQSSAEVLLQQLKWPIENLFVGMKMKDYNSSDVTLRRQHLDKWHTFTQITPTVRGTQGMRSGRVTLKNAAYAVPTAVLSLGASPTTSLRLTPSAAIADGTNVFDGIVAGDILTIAIPVALLPAVTVTLEVAGVRSDTNTIKGYLSFKQSVAAVVALTGVSTATTLTGVTASVQGVLSSELTSTVAVPSQTLDTVTITAHGVPIYNGFISKFYNSYLAYQFGGPNVNVPKDSGALLINFNLWIYE